MKKLGLFVSGLLGAASLSAQVNTQAIVKGELDTLVTNATDIFDTVVPVILAVVALGILITFAKRIKKS